MNRRHIVCTVSCEYQGTLEVTPAVLESVQEGLNQTVHE